MAPDKNHNIPAGLAAIFTDMMVYSLAYRCSVILPDFGADQLTLASSSVFSVALLAFTYR
jgi:hypothetical protein